METLLLTAPVAENSTALEPHQSSVGCITNTPWCRPVRNRIIADYTYCGKHCRNRQCERNPQQRKQMLHTDSEQHLALRVPVRVTVLISDRPTATAMDTDNSLVRVVSSASSPRLTIRSVSGTARPDSGGSARAATNDSSRPEPDGPKLPRFSRE
jgi:hypothetical protein